MPQLTEMEVQKLRELITRQDMATIKWQSYAQQCQEPQLRNYFGQCSQQANRARQALLSHLG